MRTWNTISIVGTQDVKAEMLLDTSQYLDQYIFEHNVFEPMTSRFLIDFMTGKPNCVGVDVGANIGYFTLLMAYHCRRVYAFEPVSHYFDVTRQCVERNGLTDKVILSGMALSDKFETKTMCIAGDSATFHKVHNYPDLKKQNLVCIPMDYVVPEKVDIVKIDVDGHDVFVFKGMKDVMAKGKPAIVIEFAYAHYHVAGVTPDMFFQIVTDAGYTIRSEYNPDVVFNRQELTDHVEWNKLATRSSFNAILIPNE